MLSEAAATSGRHRDERRTDAPASRRSAGASRAAVAPKVTLLRSREAVESVAAQWLELESHGSGAVLFQSLGWCSAVMDFEAERGNRGFDPVIAALWHGDRLVGLLPLERIGGSVRKSLVPLGDGFGQYSDMLLHPDVEPRPALAKMLAAAVAEASADWVRFLKVRSDSTLAAALPKGAMPIGAPEEAPFVALEQWPDFASYFASRKPKTRKNMRNARNRLERTAPLRHLLADSDDTTRCVISRTLAGRADRLREQGLTSRAFSSAAFSDFCLSLVGRDDLPLLAMSLRHGDTELAEQWGFVHNRRYYAYVATRDFDHSDESPGKLHLKEVVETCYRHGLSSADLLVPSMPYKLTWATGTVAVCDYALPLRLRGRLAAQLWDRWLRPMLKRRLLRMPVRMRSTIMKAAGRR